jgi:hypothetical protein
MRGRKAGRAVRLESRIRATAGRRPVRQRDRAGIPAGLQAGELNRQPIRNGNAERDYCSKMTSPLTSSSASTKCWNNWLAALPSQASAEILRSPEWVGISAITKRPIPTFPSDPLVSLRQPHAPSAPVASPAARCWPPPPLRDETTCYSAGTSAGLRLSKLVHTPSSPCQSPRVAPLEYSVARCSKKLACSTPLRISDSQGSGCLSMP